MRLPEFISDARNHLRNLSIPETFDAAIILGSGLGNFGGTIENACSEPYSAIPHFPVPSVKGHSGKLIWGNIAGSKVLAFSGRFHLYEGFTTGQAVLPVHFAKSLNAKKLIISNAAGGINPGYHIGDMMIIESAIRLNNNLFLKGSEPNRFNPFTLAGKAKTIAEKMEFPIHSGTYLYAKGPNYETKAEIRAFRKIGADAVGMSTVPELFEAARCGLRCVAVSLITNMAAGIKNRKLDHTEVKQTAKSNEKKFEKFICSLIAGL